MTSQTSAEVPAPAIPAGLLRRLAAAVYDGFLLMGLLFFATLLVIAVVPGHQIPAGTVLFQAYLVGVLYLFFGWFWTHGGQTLGMRAWRLRVTDMHGQDIRWPQSAARFLAAVLAWTSVIGIIWCAFDSEKRALQDRISRTRVVVLPKP